MTYLKYKLIIISSLLVLSCNNKQKSTYSEAIDSARFVHSDIVNFSLKKSPEELLFEQMAVSMKSNNLEAFKKDLALFNNIDTLISYKADVDNDVDMTYSLLGLACRLNSLDIVKELIARGANIQIGSESEYYGQDALFETIIGGNAEILNILLQKAANVNARYSESGLSPLGLCVMHKKYLMAEILLKNGAKVNGPGDQGFEYIWYPLHDAIAENDVRMVELLLKYDADISLDAIELAKTIEATEILKILENHK